MNTLQPYANMKMENSAICSKSYIEAGIVCIADLFNEDGSFRSLDSLFNLNIKTIFFYNTLGLNIVYSKE